MNKIALLLTSVLISGFVAVKYVDIPLEEPSGWLEHDKKIRDLAFRYECFKEILNSAIEDLEKKRIDLPTAQKRVEAGSRQWYPEYVEYLGWAKKGATDAERVARNLVNHVASIAGLTPSLAARARALEIEFKNSYDVSEK